MHYRHLKGFIPSRISGRGYKIGSVSVYVCQSICQLSHGWTVWHADPKFGWSDDNHVMMWCLWARKLTKRAWCRRVVNTRAFSCILRLLDHVDSHSMNCTFLVLMSILQSSRNMLDMPDMSGRLLLMSGRGLRHCRTFCPAGFNTQKMSGKGDKNCRSSTEKNVWQGIKMSGRA